MSERKTTEIKLRVSPDEKTSWQLAAEEEQIGLSEFARRAMNDRARQSAECWDYEIPVVASEFVPPGFAVLTAQEYLAESVAFATLEAVTSTPEDEDSSATQAVPTSGEADVVAKPWTFEARKGD